jgi:hypothetical protein
VTLNIFTTKFRVAAITAEDLNFARLSGVERDAAFVHQLAHFVFEVAVT